MEIAFDPIKDEANLVKHGISLTQVTRINWDKAIIEIDNRRDYGEMRQFAFAPIADRIYCVVYVERGHIRRIISLRKANSRECKDYYVRSIKLHFANT